MRNKQAARYARWSAVIAVLLGALVAGIYFRRSWQARQAEQQAPPAVPSSVQQQSATFSFSKETGNHTEFTVRASHATQFNDGGRALLEDVWITAYGQTSQRFDNLHTRACDYVQSTGDITCKGDVQIELESAEDAKRFPGTGDKPNAQATIVHIATSHVVFNRQTGRATTDQRVVFGFPQGDGSAIGFLYDSDQGDLHLLHDVELRFHQSPSNAASVRAAQETPDSTSASTVPPARSFAVTAEPLAVSGSSLLYNRDERVLHLLGPVKAQQGAEQLTAGLLDVELDEALRARRVVAKDHPQLVDRAANGPVTVAADQFVAPVSTGGWVERVIAIGNVRADQRGPADENRLTAARAEVELSRSQNQPRHLLATGNVTVDSHSPEGFSGARISRHLTTSQLDMDFVTGTAAGSRTGPYISVASTPAAIVDWTSSPYTSDRTHADKSGGSEASGLQRIHLTAGHLIGTFGNANELEALRGSSGVRVERQVGDASPEISTSHDVTVLFEHGDKSSKKEWATVDPSGDVRFHQDDRMAEADRAHFDRSSDTVTLTGSVVLSDADSRTTAQRASLNHATNELRAEGRVATIELSSGSNGVADFAPGPARISGDRLAANSSAKQAIYSGHARLWQGDSLVEADSIELDRAAQLLTASGQVRAIFPQAPWKPAANHSSGVGVTGPSGHSSANGRASAAGPSAKVTPQSEYWRVEAGRMTYADNDSHARLEQSPRAHSNEGSIRSDLMDLYFVPRDSEHAGTLSANSQTLPVSTVHSTAGKQLDRAVAQGSVVIDQEDRHGTGDRADYTAADGKIVLSGGPPKVRDGLGNSSTGRQLTLFFADDKILVDSADGLRTLTMHQVEK